MKIFTILICLFFATTFASIGQFEGNTGGGYFTDQKINTPCSLYSGDDFSGAVSSNVLVLSNCSSYTGDSLSGYASNNAGTGDNCDNFIGGDYSGHTSNHFENPDATCFLFTESTNGGSGYHSLNANDCFVITLGINASPLFAELISNTTGRLHWETFAERNNAGFDIQKSIDGEEWISIGWLDGQTNSSTTTAYSFLDEDMHAAINYYRFIQMDLNGVRSTSNIVVLQPDKPTSLQDVFVLFPNPTNQQNGLKLKAWIHNDYGLEIHVYDLFGKTILSDEIDFSPIQNEYHFPIERFAPGSYNLSIKVEGQTEHVLIPFVVTN